MRRRLVVGTRLHSRSGDPPRWLIISQVAPRTPRITRLLRGGERLWAELDGRTPSAPTGDC